MSDSARRICSLLPSATEIVCALGLEERLVGVTHECDFPHSVQDLPRVTSSVIDSEGLSAAQIDQAVRDSLADQATIYHLDRDLLDALHPDLVLTQELCDVCAVGPDEVRSVIKSLSQQPHVVSLEPRTLEEVFDSILLVGRLTGSIARAQRLVGDLRARLRAVSEAVRGCPRPGMLTLEWIDPVFVGGHWVPEMVRIAGGYDVLGQVGRPSREASWDEVRAAAPEVVVAMLCGFDLDRTVREMRSAHLADAWHALPAVREGRVFATDGSSYFSRPGPRLVDGVEVLASILHPEVCDRAPARSFAPIAAVRA